MSRTVWPPVVLTVLAVLVAGCSSTPGGTGTAAANDQAVKFSECMRANGIGAFPDPNASGELTIDAVANGSSLNTSSPAFKRAMSACKGLEPPGFVGNKLSAGQQKVALKFAQCIRDNGVPDFPDPANGGPLVDTNRIPSAATASGMSLLKAAMRTCGAIYSGELGVTSP